MFPCLYAIFKDREAVVRDFHIGTRWRPKFKYPILKALKEEYDDLIEVINQFNGGVHMRQIIDDGRGASQGSSPSNPHIPFSTMKGGDCWKLNFCGASRFPCKLQAFLWLILNNAILTRGNLLKHHICPQRNAQLWTSVGNLWPCFVWMYEGQRGVEYCGRLFSLVDPLFLIFDEGRDPLHVHPFHYKWAILPL